MSSSCLSKMQLSTVFSFLIVTGAAQYYGTDWRFEHDIYSGQPFNWVRYVPERLPSFQDYETRMLPYPRSNKAAHSLVGPLRETSTLAPFVEPIPKAALKEHHILDLFNTGTFVCPKQNGMFYMNGLCNIFFVCTNGQPEFFHCTSGMVFNPEEEICDLPQRTACDIQCPEYNGTTGIPGKCNQYIDCTNGYSKVMSCPGNLHYSQLFHSCVRPRIARCKFTCPRKYGLYPIPGYCEEYIKCMDGKVIYQRCSSGLYFNNKIKMCDIPERTSCVHNCPHPDGTFPVEGDCSLFIKCVNNVPEVGFCNEGYCFNIFTNECELPNVVERRHQCPSPNGRFALPGHRPELFIECAENIMSIKVCPPGLQYNAITENCGFEDKFKKSLSRIRNK